MERPRTRINVTELVIKFAKENSGWGYVSIEGALLNLGHDIGRSTIARVLKNAGIPIAPKRKDEMTWEQFLKAHWDVMGATDFFTTEVWTLKGLVRYHILFVIRLAPREVKIVGIVPEPYGEWMMQMGRNLLDCEDGFMIGCRLIHDQGNAFTKDFRKLLDRSGVSPIRLPRKSPNLNAFSERWVRSARVMCIDRLIFFGDDSFRHAVGEMEIYYNRERAHQGLGNRIINPFAEEQLEEGVIECRSRLGGLMNYYYRKAA